MLVRPTSLRERRLTNADSVMAGKKHPWLLGKPGNVGWSEIWDGLAPLALAAERGETTYIVDSLVFLEGRSGDDPLMPTRDEA